MLDFLLLGVGTLYVGKRPIVGGFLMVGAIVCTCVELQLMDLDMGLHWAMFVGFFLLAIGQGCDGWTEADTINGELDSAWVEQRTTLPHHDVITFK